MYLRLLSILIILLSFSSIGKAQGELNIIFEPTDYPVDRDDLLLLKATNTTTEAIDVKLVFEVRNEVDKILYSWSVPKYSIPAGTQIIDLKAASGISSTADLINSVQREDRMIVYVKTIIESPYNYSEKTAILEFPAKSFDFNSKFTQIDTESDSSSSMPLIELQASADRTNVIYIGVDNPLTVIGADESTTLSCNKGIIITPVGNGRFIARAHIPGEYTLLIQSSTGGITQKIRAKRIPDPVAHLGNKMGGNISVGEFQSQIGVITLLERFNFDVKCQASGYTLFRVQNDGTRSYVNNKDAQFLPETQQLIALAKPGDIYIFSNIRAKCPRDIVTRSIPGMTFFIR